MKKYTVLFLVTLYIFYPLVCFAEKLEITVPDAKTVEEEMDLKIDGVSVSDGLEELNVKLSVIQGKIKVDDEHENKIKAGTNKSRTFTLKGKAEEINTILKTLVYTGDKNFYGPETLTVIASTTAKRVVDTLHISVTNGVPSGSQACNWRNRVPKTVHYSGDLGDNVSVGSVASYSLLRYNLADKKSSFNAKAAGFGLSFRYYTNGDLQDDFGVKSIKNIPKSCRANTEDLLDSNNKITSKVSLSPTFYLFKGATDDDFGVQIALNVGFFNDLLSLGVGWNLSGEDAGEWFFLAGPSFGFKF